MIIIYRLIVLCLIVLVRISSIFSVKLKKWLKQSDQAYPKLADKKAKRIWFHLASLGEYEQCLPLIDKLKETYPKIEIALSFFSSSGYLQINHEDYLVVTYFPIDSPGRVKKFLKFLKPDIAIFNKYEFWAEMFFQLKKRKIPLIYVNFLLQEQNVYVKKLKYWFKYLLKKVDYFYCLDVQTHTILKNMGFNNASITGDLRWKRVIDIARTPFKDTKIEAFKKDKPLFIWASILPKDFELFKKCVSSILAMGFQIVLVPHHLDKKFLKAIQYSYSRHLTRYSETTNLEHPLLLVDRYGLLSKIYRYADMVYLGGGFDRGIHNLQEPTAYHLPVFFGPNFKKFPEVISLVKLGLSFPIDNAEKLLDQIKKINNPEQKKALTIALKTFIQEQKKAVEQILLNEHFKK